MTSPRHQRAVVRCVGLPLALGEGWGEGSPGKTSTLASLQHCAEGCSAAPAHVIPSRYDNPFATCWIKPGAIPFHFAAGESAGDVLKRLADAKWRGAIIGPHGSGKSTLLEALKPRLVAAGHVLTMIALRNGQCSLPRDFVKCLRSYWVARPEALRTAWSWGAALTTTPFQGVPPIAAISTAPSPIVIIDGYEQLTRLERLKLIVRCRRRSLGLIVTSHRRTCLPTLIELAPNLTLVEQLVAELCNQVSTHVDPKFVAASHACHGSNMREIFFDLYDRYERTRRDTRTATRTRS